VTFFEFLERQVDRDDLIGDFARDAVEDQSFPRSNDLDVYVEYLPDAKFIQEIFAAAWSEYAGVAT
jgi:uncharacterized protein YozE (UPF0346 family)